MLLKQRLGRKVRSLTLGWTFTAFAEISRAVELHLAEARCPEEGWRGAGRGAFGSYGRGLCSTMYPARDGRDRRGLNGTLRNQHQLRTP